MISWVHREIEPLQYFTEPYSKREMLQERERGRESSTVQGTELWGKRRKERPVASKVSLEVELETEKILIS